MKQLYIPKDAVTLTLTHRAEEIDAYIGMPFPPCRLLLRRRAIPEMRMIFLQCYMENYIPNVSVLTSLYSEAQLDYHKNVNYTY